jgi:hypothetical protein
VNGSIVQRLIGKDWYLLRKPALGYLAGGIISVLLLQFGGAAAFNIGCILIITLLIALGMHVVMATVVGERIEHTLPFVMSLPISIAQYTLAKIVANATMFVGGWLIITLGVCGVVLFRDGVPHGLIMLSSIMLGYLLASYFVLLAVALITESMGVTIGTVITSNILLNVLMYAIGTVPSIRDTYSSTNIVWTSVGLCVLAGEAAVVAIALAATFIFQARKTNFL